MLEFVNVLMNIQELKFSQLDPILTVCFYFLTFIEYLLFENHHVSTGDCRINKI